MIKSHITKPSTTLDLILLIRRAGSTSFIVHWKRLVGTVVVFFLLLSDVLDRPLHSSHRRQQPTPTVTNQHQLTVPRCRRITFQLNFIDNIAAQRLD